MEQITGIGSFFFRLQDPTVLAAWYEAHFGIMPVLDSYGAISWWQDEGPTVFAPFAADTDYFGKPAQVWMINFRVRDLGAMVAQLRAANIALEVDPETYPNGRFARTQDPEGNPKGLTITVHRYARKLDRIMMTTVETAITDEAVLQAFLAFPPNIQSKIMALRDLIFATAANTEGVGAIEETLKWGEPAYLTSASKSGSTIRLGWKQANPTQYAMYFICHTNLVARFRAMFPDELHFEGDRAIVFQEADPVPTEALTLCIAEALTYHSNKRAL